MYDCTLCTFHLSWILSTLMFTISALKLGMDVPVKMLRSPFFSNNHPCCDVKGLLWQLELSPAQLFDTAPTCGRQLRLSTIYTNATTVNYTTQCQLCY